MTGPDLSSAKLDDERWLAATLRFARRHVGLTGENPCVGALIVAGEGSNARVVGRGVTARGGRPHAERLALNEAGEAARGATAYVTLEPCAHYGHTSPCSEALVAAGIRRVVFGASDPDPRVDGRGAAKLCSGGVVVRQLDHLPQETRSFEGFLLRIRSGRPFVTLKMAVSADGFVGREGEGQIAISGPVARRQTHILRAETDAILIGAGTALADLPLLTCRLPGLEDRSPVRVILDRRLRLGVDHPLVWTARQLPTIVATAASVDGRVRALEEAGCRILPMGTGDGALADLMRNLVTQGISSVLVEGGPSVANAFLSDDLIDRIIVVRSDRRIGGTGVPAPAALRTTLGFRQTVCERFGSDTWLEFERKNV